MLRVNCRNEYIGIHRDTLTNQGERNMCRLQLMQIAQNAYRRVIVYHRRLQIYEVAAKDLLRMHIIRQRTRFTQHLLYSRFGMLTTRCMRVCVLYINIWLILHFARNISLKWLYNVWWRRSTSTPKLFHNSLTALVAFANTKVLFKNELVLKRKNEQLNDTCNIKNGSFRICIQCTM